MQLIIVSYIMKSTCSELPRFFFLTLFPSIRKRLMETKFWLKTIKIWVYFLQLTSRWQHSSLICHVKLKVGKIGKTSKVLSESFKQWTQMFPWNDINKQKKNRLLVKKKKSGFRTEANWSVLIYWFQIFRNNQPSCWAHVYFSHSF